MKYAQVLENDLSTEVLGHSHLVSIELVTTELVESSVATEARVLVFNFAHNIPHGLALMEFLVISADNRVKDCPHDLG